MYTVKIRRHEIETRETITQLHCLSLSLKLQNTTANFVLLCHPQVTQ